ncbi:unnamed protein product, partial [Phaeothamnion confervicola]
GGERRDRFIPTRSAMNMEMSNYILSKEDAENVSVGASADDCEADGAAPAFKSALEANLLNRGAAGGGAAGAKKEHRVLSFRDKAPAPPEGHVNGLKVLYAQGKARDGAAPGRVTRHVPSAPVRVLDAPDMLDDYYLNLVSWGANDVLAVALGQTVYLWEAASGNITELMTLDGSSDYVSSVSWIQDGGNHLAVGTASAQTQLWDVAVRRQVRGMDGHSARVGALGWNRHLLSSGSRDTTIVQHDVRVRAHAVSTLRGHDQEVCGLAWSPDGATLASGANDNTVCLWDASTSAVAGSGAAAQPRFRLTEHQAAVKALAWCPFERNLLATGGGTADRCIKFWSSATGAMINSVDTGSQVCSLVWSRTERELLSSHGFSQNQLCLWKYPSMAKVKELTGHTSRVLHMALSPDGRTVVSGAGDESLRFWDVFAAPAKAK